MDNYIRPAFDGHILPVDTAVALRCARLHVPDRRSDRDAMIAATALLHDLIVVTRNVGDFAHMNVALINPWD
jgi:toxin FitB